MVTFNSFELMGSLSVHVVIKLPINIWFIWVFVKTTNIRVDHVQMVKWVIVIP